MISIRNRQNIGRDRHGPTIWFSVWHSQLWSIKLDESILGHKRQDTANSVKFLDPSWKLGFSNSFFLKIYLEYIKNKHLNANFDRTIKISTLIIYKLFMDRNFRNLGARNVEEQATERARLMTLSNRNSGP